ncbi:hypothetical protein [Oceaniferula spumae]
MQCAGLAEDHAEEIGTSEWLQRDSAVGRRGTGDSAGSMPAWFDQWSS